MTRRDASAGSGDNRSVARYLRRHGLHVVTAESCTAGLIASRIAEVPGCGDVLYCSIVAYSPSAKEQLLRVPPETIRRYGLTSEEVDRMETEGLTHAREDMQRHRIVDLITNSRLDLKWIGERLERYGAKLEAQQRAQLESLMAELRAMLERAEADWASVNADAFARAKQAVDEASVRLQEIGIAESLREDL